MKTILLPSPMKAFFFALIVLAASSMQQVYAQAAMLTTMPTATDNAAAVKSSKVFQSTAFPVSNTGKVQVIFQDPTGNGASIVIRDNSRNIVYSKNHSNKGTHISNLDLSPLPDGAYTVEVIALTKAGFCKEKYSYNFHIQSTINRSLTPVNKQMEKKLFIPRHYQVSR